MAKDNVNTQEDKDEVSLDLEQPDAIEDEALVDVAEEGEVLEGSKKDENDALMSENAELKDLLQRTRADFENFRKQTEKQRSQAAEIARYATVEKFLPLIDDFSRALDAYPEQLQPLAKNLEKTLKNLGLEMIDSEVGMEFNPDYHEAVSMDDSGDGAEIVAETLRPGYLYEGAVLRPAMVKVTTNSEAE